MKYTKKVYCSIFIEIYTKKYYCSIFNEKKYFIYKNEIYVFTWKIPWWSDVS